MRTGLIFSFMLHIAVFGFGIFTIAGTRLNHHAEEIELVPIELVPIAEEMALQEGNKQAPNLENSAPKPTQKPEITPQANHVGDGQVDSSAPLRPNERQRPVEATPPPPAAEPIVTEVPPPPEQVLKPAPQPAAQANLDPKAVEAEQENLPSPMQQTAPAEQPAAQIVAALPQLPPTPPKPKQKPKLRNPTPPQNETNLDDILTQNSTLIDRTPIQGGGARRSEATASLGASRNIGSDRQLAQTIQNVIGACIKDKARITALSGSRSHNLVVKVHMRLNRDGSIEGVPDLTPSGGDVSEREIAVTQGYAALARCAPFRELPPERYDDGWFDVTINWRPLE